MHGPERLSKIIHSVPSPNQLFVGPAPRTPLK
ncbi:hypothetical protein ISN45_At01g026730 [Arabidopsis thaliana x Arabidopsis arenosa]|uniref:Uncharacterized protein n=1 Tax=Arabidopsis thaliana x Arabidopsis arenosa TaxID=1240361 RepID=A0A8T2GK06_9BRAS|nr:hypothetical protein ISN45_At01g026730 [Arabidopsis thaliana x Arabidopsis arenosa]